MSKVAALGQVHTHHGVAGIDQRQEDCGVGLGACMGLDVGVVAIEQRLDPFDGQALGHVHILAAAVVALARIALGILVGEHRVLDGHHQRAGIVLGGDQLDMVLLATFFAQDGFGQIGVEVGEDQGCVMHEGVVLWSGVFGLV
ncbi:hypothetical protein D3C85_809660 [compost metagenome]